MPVREPVEESVRLVGQSELEERVERERGVAQPGEPIVPVARSTDRLGKARRRGCHDGSGRRICHQLERERRAPDVLLVRTGVAAPLDPLPPVASRGPEQLVRPFDRPRFRAAASGPATSQGERGRLAGPQREGRVARTEIDGRRQAQAETAGVGMHVPVGLHGQGHVLTSESGSGIVYVSHAHMAGQALDVPDDAGFVTKASLRLDVPLVDGHVVGERDYPCAGREDGVEEVGAVAVMLPGAECHSRADLPATSAGRIEDAAEHRVTVEARKAEKVDAAVETHERGAAAVADQPVPLDGQIATRPPQAVLHAGAHRHRD